MEAVGFGFNQAKFLDITKKFENKGMLGDLFNEKMSCKTNMNPYGKLF